ncbi:hypothetical protein YC2023_055540 [Brassica napus]
MAGKRVTESMKQKRSKLGNSLNQREPEVTDELKKLEYDLMELIQMKLMMICLLHQRRRRRM